MSSSPEYAFYDATFSIDGKPVDLDIKDIVYKRLTETKADRAERLEGFGCSLEHFWEVGVDYAADEGPRTYECVGVCSVKIRRRVWRQFILSMRRPRYVNASFATLMKRAGYGGRRGRRALRRLMAMPDSTWKSELGGDGR